MKQLLAIALLVAACSSEGSTATVAPAPVVTEQPEQVPDAVIEPESDGSGIITFGTRYDPDTLEIAKPVTRFKRTFPEIAWSAWLTRPVGATSVEVVLASQSASGGERVIMSEDTEISNPDADLLANSADLALLVDNKAGTYVMRYIESGEVLAEGTFTLVK